MDLEGSANAVGIIQRKAAIHCARRATRCELESNQGQKICNISSSSCPFSNLTKRLKYAPSFQKTDDQKTGSGNRGVEAVEALLPLVIARVLEDDAHFLADKICAQITVLTIRALRPAELSTSRTSAASPRIKRERERERERGERERWIPEYAVRTLKCLLSGSAISNLTFFCKILKF